MSGSIQEYQTRLRDALAFINQQKAKIEALQQAKSEPIAIVGMACRFPGGGVNPEAFFRALEAGVDGIREIPPERWSASEIPGDRPEARWAGLIDSIDGFDAAFFEVAPREAESMDPQQRVLLEVTWEALEDAGQRPDGLKGSRTGVFLGMATQDYLHRAASMGLERLDGYVGTGNMASTAAGRLSFVLGMQGPCMSVDTACSSSLVSVHLACQSLRNGESHLAIAGGVNAILSPLGTHLMTRLSALSPDGRCKTFDARANGYVRGEGCGIVVLKRLSDAQRDGDRILAIIRGSAVNQDGRSTGLTTPNVLAQEALLRQALANARVKPGEIGYVETHGTGTSLGDPIEIEALRNVLGEPRADGSPCFLGALKTNIGHLEAAAGVAGLVKVVQVLRKGVVPKNLHFQTLNPRIDLAGTPFVIPRKNEPFLQGSIKRLASVSSFGISGTNAHVILEEAPPEEPRAAAAEASAYLLPISAKHPEALTALAAAYAERLAAGDADRLPDIVSAASLGRAHHDHRLAAVGATREALASALAAAGSGQAHPGMARGRTPARGPSKIVFVFPGQGSQWIGMGRQLLAEVPAFREALEACDAVIRAEAGFSVLEELAADEARSRLGTIDVVQPLLFAVEVALAAAWRAWGVEPDCVVGHSMGEVAAAHVAGLLDLADAAKVICRRSRLLRRVSGKGAMALVELAMAEAEAAIVGYEDRLGVAVSNGPRSTVLSGDPSALEDVLRMLEQKGVFARRVKVDVASHSPQVDPLRDDLLDALRDLRPHAGRVAMRSTVTGAALEGRELDARYWAANLREPVRFSQVTQALMKEGHGLFVELSPHPILLPSIEENLKAASVEGAAIGSMRRQTDERRCMLEALGALYVRGASVDWGKVHPARGRVVSLPTYAWRRERFWMEMPKGLPAKPGAHGGASGAHPLLGRPFTTSARSDAWFWQLDLRVEDLPWLADHRIGGAIVAPGSLYVEAALAAARERLGSGVTVLEELVFTSPLRLEETSGTAIEIALEPAGPEAWAFRFSSLSREEGAAPTWILHATARVRRESAEGAPRSSRLSALRERIRTPVDMEALARAEAALGLSIGPSFQGLRSAFREGGEVLGHVELGEGTQSAPYLLHPAWLDSAFRTAMAARDTQGSEPRVLASARTIRFSGGRTGSGVCHARVLGTTAAVTLFDEEGRILLEAEGLETRALPRTTDGEDPHAAFFVAQQWEPADAVAAPETGSAGRWLVLCDDEGFGKRISTLLRACGHEVLCASADTGERAADGTMRRVNPEAAEEVTALVREALAGGARLTGVVDCSGLAPAVRAPEETRGLEVAAVRGCGGALHLVQALLQSGLRDMPRLWLVVAGSQTVADEPRDVSVAQAPLWGLGRVIAMEHPDLRCRRIDIDPASTEADAEALVRELLADVAEEEIVLRGGRRFVGRLVPLRNPPSPSASTPLRGDATYLITGGLGSLGLWTAKWLAGAGARHIVLLSRRGPTEPAQAEAVVALQSMGVEVVVARADVARRDELAAVLRDIDERMPPLRGVLHMAGVLEDGALENQSLERFRKVLAPKMLGAWNLDALTAGRPLDFFLLYSSIAGLLGSPGLGNYVAANVFLDVFAHHRRRRGLVATSVSWGLFADVGMGIKAAGAGRSAEQGIRGFSTAEGEALLVRVLGATFTQVGIVALDFRRWIESYPQAASLPRFAHLAREARASGGAAEPRDNALVESLSRATPPNRASLLEGFVLEKLGEILRMDSKRIDPTAPLRSLGIDSIMSLELRNRLEASLGIRLSATLVFAYPTPAALTEHLLERLDLAGAQPAAIEHPDAPGAPAEDPGTSSEEGSEDDVEARLAAKLAALEKFLD